MGKSWDEFWDFDDDEYEKRVSTLSREDLQKLHAVVSQKVLGASAGVGAGIGGAFFTAGVSLVGSAIAGRRVNVNDRRKKIIEKRLADEGWDKYKIRKRDMIIPLAAIGVVGMVAPGADAVIGHFASHAATHAATHASTHVASTAAAHHTADAVRVAADHPETFAKAIEHGASNQLAELTNGAVGHIASTAPVNDLASYQANVLGSAAGDVLMKTAEVKASTFAAGQATQYGLETAFMSTPPTKTPLAPTVEVCEIHLSRTSSNTSSPSSANEAWHLLPPHPPYTPSSPAFSPNLALAWCAEHNIPTLIAPLLSRGASLSTPHAGCVPLIRAAKAGHASLIPLLHSQHAPIDTPTAAGNTALMLAANGGHVETVQALLELGADVGQRNAEGWTALHFAARAGEEGVVRALSRAGAERESENGRGETAGDLAAAWGHWGVVGVLVD
ncbi:Ankyrin repeat domain-containing protein 44 [Trapelia coarctata]|nr:Ankyrin repeat domain-containing protein 44 [Trapelia coarctata]